VDDDGGDDDGGKELEMAIDILSYFVRNPRAADDLPGVARWRLLDEVLHRDLPRIERAVQWLVREGFLLVGSHPGTSDVYTLNPRRLADAQQLLSRSRTSSSID